MQQRFSCSSDSINCFAEWWIHGNLTDHSGQMSSQLWPKRLNRCFGCYNCFMTHTHSYKRLSHVSMNAVIFLGNERRALRLLGAFSVCSLLVCISTSMNSQFCDSEREWGLKKEEVSLGSRIVNNICYRSHGESGGRSGRARFTSGWLIQPDGNKKLDIFLQLDAFLCLVPFLFLLGTSPTSSITTSYSFSAYISSFPSALVFPPHFISICLSLSFSSSSAVLQPLCGRLNLRCSGLYPH